jgi:hypothetical protein
MKNGAAFHTGMAGFSARRFDPASCPEAVSQVSRSGFSIFTLSRSLS